MESRCKAPLVTHCLVALYYVFRLDGVTTKHELWTFVEDEHPLIYEIDRRSTDAKMGIATALHGEPAAPNARRLYTSCGWLILLNLCRRRRASFSEGDITTNQTTTNFRPVSYSIQESWAASPNGGLQVGLIGRWRGKRIGLRYGSASRQQGDVSPLTEYTTQPSTMPARNPAGNWVHGHSDNEGHTVGHACQMPLHAQNRVVGPSD